MAAISPDAAAPERASPNGGERNPGTGRPGAMWRSKSVIQMVRAGTFAREQCGTFTSPMRGGIGFRASPVRVGAAAVTGDGDPASCGGGGTVRSRRRSCSKEVMAIPIPEEEDSGLEEDVLHDDDYLLRGTKGGAAWATPHPFVPELGPCASSGRAQRLWAVQHSQGENLRRTRPGTASGARAIASSKVAYLLSLAIQTGGRQISTGR